MKRPALLLSLSMAGFLSGGCLAINIGRRPPPSPPPVEAFAPPVAYVATADSVTISEINAATRLTFENNRLEAMKNIAGRTNLSAAVQVHLVRSTYRGFALENNKMTLLGVIIANPCLCNAAKEAILSGLDGLTFSNNRTSILAALNQRGDLKE